MKQKTVLTFMVQRGPFTEIACLFVAVLLSFYFSLTYCRSLSDPLDHPLPFQLTFTYPAVFFAAGHGLGTTDIEKIPTLTDFIHRRTTSFDIAHIPDDISLKPLTTAWELTHIYHIYAVGWFWRLFGVSVDSLLLLAATLSAMSAAALYFLFRLGMSRGTSLVGVLLVHSSPAMLYMANILREHGKTPFFIGAIYVMLRLVVAPVSKTRLFALAVLLGLLLGIGVGFRQDLLICLPPAAIVLLFFSRLENASTWLWRATAVLLFGVTFLVLGWPVFRGMALEGSQPTVHTFFQGLAPEMEAQLGFGKASYIHHGAKDNEVYAQVNTFAQRYADYSPVRNPNTAEYRRQQGNRDGPLVVDPGLLFMGPEYARLGRILMNKMLWIFPADVVGRAWASVIAIYSMPLRMYEDMENIDTNLPVWLKTIRMFHGILAWFVSLGGFPLVLAMLTMVATVRFKLALCLAGLLLWFTGYPSILFEYRHCSHLIFIPLGVLIWWSAYLIRVFIKSYRSQNYRQRLSKCSLPIHLGHGLAFVLMLTIALLVPMFLLRYWQIEQVHDLADGLAASSREPFPVESQQINTHILISPKGPLPGLAQEKRLEAGETAWEYLAVTFDTHGYDIPLTLLYDQQRRINDYTQTLTVYGVDDDREGRVTVFFPVYDSSLYCPDSFFDYITTIKAPAFRENMKDPRPVEEQEWLMRSKFLGISFPDIYKQFFVRLYLVRDIESLPMLPILQVPQERHYLRPYKTGPWERRFRAFLARLLTGGDGGDDMGKWRGLEAGPPPHPAPEQEPGHDVWSLDEEQLRHQWPDSFDGLLLREDSAEDYITTWQTRVAYLPDLSYVAAQDLARAGTVWVGAERLAAAAAAYRAAIALDNTTALYYLRLGQILTRQGNFTAAIVCFHQAMLRHPFLPDTADKVVRIYATVEDDEGLIHFWDSLYTRYPKDWFIGMRTGKALEFVGNIVGASHIFKQVHQTHPEHPNTRMALARCLIALEQKENAWRLLKSTVASHPETKTAASYILALLAEQFKDADDWTMALQVYHLAVHCNPTDPGLLLHLGDAQESNNQLCEALQTFKVALVLVKEEHDALEQLIRERIRALKNVPASRTCRE